MSCASPLLLVFLSYAGPLLAAGEASAPPEEGGLRIESSTCSHPWVDEVQYLAGVELSGAGLPEGADAPKVVLTCSGSVVLIRAVLGAQVDSRQVDLGQTDESLHARVVALASAELVRDTASHAAQPPPPPPPPDAPLVAKPPAPAPASNRLFVFTKLSNFGASFEPLYGAGLGISHDFGRFALGLDPEFAASRREVALGSVHLLAADFALRLAVRFPSRVLPGELGVGHTLGWARLQGKGATPDAISNRISGVWGGPFVFAGIESALGAPFFLHVAAELGVVTVPVRGEVARAADVGMRGAWAGLRLGVGARW